MVLSKRSLHFEYTESGSGSTIFRSQPSLIYSLTLNRREDNSFKPLVTAVKSKRGAKSHELAVEARASYLFTNCAFVYNPFNVSPLHLEVLPFLACQAVCFEEKLQEYHLL